jgi:hypothetical protein
LENEMTENVTAPKKTRKPKSKAAQIRKLFEQGKLTPKEVGAKTGAPMPYVYVVRSKMKAEAGGLPAVSTKSPIPVTGGIQEVASESAAREPQPQPSVAINLPAAEQFKHVYTPSPALGRAYVTLEKPPLMERIRERIRAWLS